MIGNDPNKPQTGTQNPNPKPGEGDDRTQR